MLFENQSEAADPAEIHVKMGFEVSPTSELNPGLRLQLGFSKF
jgi:hypothetical protein